MRLVNHAFEMPVVVPPQIAEDFEGVEDTGRRSKSKSKGASTGTGATPAKPVMQAKVRGGYPLPLAMA